MKKRARNANIENCEIYEGKVDVKHMKQKFFAIYDDRRREKEKLRKFIVTFLVVIAAM